MSSASSSRASTSASTRRRTRSSGRPRAPTRSSSTTRRAATASEQTQTTFEGDGGPQLDNVFTKLVYALKFQSEQIFLSDAVNDDSQILYDRDPIERVQKVAPYLTLDTDTYPSVVDGRIVWIVDGYTLTDQYPYSNKVSMSEAIADSESLPQTLAVRRGQLHPQLGEGHGRRLRRLGHALRVGRRGPDPPDVAEDLPDARSSR